MIWEGSGAPAVAGAAITAMSICACQFVQERRSIVGSGQTTAMYPSIRPQTNNMLPAMVKVLAVIFFVAVMSASMAERWRHIGQESSAAL